MGVEPPSRLTILVVFYPPGDLLRPNVSEDALVHTQEGLQDVPGGEGEARGGGRCVETAAEHRWVKPC